MPVLYDGICRVDDCTVHVEKLISSNFTISTFLFLDAILRSISLKENVPDHEMNELLQGPRRNKSPNPAWAVCWGELKSTFSLLFFLLFCNSIQNS